MGRGGPMWASGGPGWAGAGPMWAGGGLMGRCGPMAVDGQWYMRRQYGSSGVTLGPILPSQCLSHVTAIIN